jgi:hypothetical protein
VGEQRHVLVDEEEEEEEVLVAMAWAPTHNPTEIKNVRFSFFILFQNLITNYILVLLEFTLLSKWAFQSFA